MNGKMKKGCLTLSPDDEPEHTVLTKIAKAIRVGGTVTVKANDESGETYTITFDGERALP